MIVRNVLGGVALVAVAAMLSATRAAAQTITYTSVVNPPTGGVFNGSAAGVEVDASNSGASVLLDTPKNILLSNLSNVSTVTGTLPATNYTITIGIADNQNAGQIVTHQLTGTLSANPLGPTGGNFTNVFHQTSLLYTYSNGDSLTLQFFGFVPPGSNPPVVGTIGSIGALATFTPTTQVFAPEPGSIALVATGMLSALGMVGVRRRRAA